MSVEEYIKSKEKFSRMPFATVYAVIVELIADGYVNASAFEKDGDPGVAACKLEPARKKCGGLHCKGDCHCNKESVG